MLADSVGGVQLVAGLFVPLTLGYCLERWQRASFIWQLQSEAGGSSGGRADDGRPTFMDARRSVDADRTTVTDSRTAELRACTSGYDAPVPLWADMLLVAAVLPMLGAVFWQLLNLWLMTPSVALQP